MTTDMDDLKDLAKEMKWHDWLKLPFMIGWGFVKVLALLFFLLMVMGFASMLLGGIR